MSMHPLYVPKLIGLTDIPAEAQTSYTAALRGLPDDKALVFEYQSKDAVRRAQSVLPTLAQKIGLLTNTRTYKTEEGTYRLLIWKRRPCDRGRHAIYGAYPMIVQFTTTNQEA